jgi:hypothetical protein
MREYYYMNPTTHASLTLNAQNDLHLENLAAISCPGCGSHRVNDGVNRLEDIWIVEFRKDEYEK